MEKNQKPSTINRAATKTTKKTGPHRIIQTIQHRSQSWQTSCTSKQKTTPLIKTISRRIYET